MQNLFWTILFLPPVFYSLGNLLDKRLVSIGGERSSLIITTLSALSSIIALPAILLFIDVSSPNLTDFLIMAFSGFFTSVSTFLYLAALERDSIYSVAPALQLGPVFAFLLGFYFLKESISITQVVGGLVVILSSIYLTVNVEVTQTGKKFDFSTFLLTTLSAFMLSVSATLFKFMATGYGYWTVQFFEYIGIAIAGLILIVSSKKIRENISVMIRFNRNRSNFLVLYFATEGVMITSDLVLNFATLLAPLVVVFTINSTQPIFLVVLSIVLHYFKPSSDIDINSRKDRDKILLFIFIISIGSLLVALG